jgi:iron complex transport system substrate-binding protein
LPAIVLLLVLLVILTGGARIADADAGAGTGAGEPADPLAAQRPRVISLVPAATEMLFAMGAGDRVVAVSSFDRFPPEVASRPRVGALVDPDFERVLSLRPDLVVVHSSQTDLVARLDRARIAHYAADLVGLGDVTATLRVLGERVGEAARARYLAGRIELAIDDLRRLVAGRRRPRTAFVFGREAGALRSVYASAGVGFMHDMLVAAGGDNVFGDVGRESLQVSTEVLLARAPDVIVEAHGGDGWPPERILRESLLWRGLPALPAVRSNRVYVLADDRLIVPGPRVADGVRVLARALHPEVVK